VLVVEILSREFNQDVSRAKRAAQDGPVIITDRDKPAYVLMRHETYRHLVGDGPTICELLDCPGVEDIEFEIPRLGEGIFRPADLLKCSCSTPTYYWSYGAGIEQTKT
jgi:hypothetical protein